MVSTQEPTNPDTENPGAVPPVIEPAPEPAPDIHDDPPPETINLSQEDEGEQAQTFADAALYGGNDIGLSDTYKAKSGGSSGDDEDDVQDLVDHMNDMVASGRIDMDAFRGERNDDDEEGSLGPAGEDE